jgi:hypothetical protein
MERVLPPDETGGGMPPGSRGIALVALSLLLAVAAVGGHAAAPPDDGNHQIDDRVRANSTIAVELRADGDARIRVSTAFNLTTDEQTAAYRELAASFADGDEPALGLDAYRRASELAATDTGREMEITDVQRQTATERVVANGTGRLAVSFTWTNFARVGDDRIHVDDTFRSGWLSGLEPGQTLRIQAPDGFSVFDSEVPPENATLAWTGPTELSPETLDATFTGPSGPTRTPTPTPEQPGPAGAMLWVVVLTVGLGSGGLALYVFARRSGGFDVPGMGEASDPNEERPTTRAEPATERVESDETSEQGAEREDDDGVDEELLSDEERVEYLLESNGGRMKQATIVKETGWSNAKVSQLLSAMEEEGRIDKLRIGRENLISFPDEDVTDLEE